MTHILLHPNIPKPLHGVNPRSLMNDKWWDDQRHKAYRVKDFHCHSCGIHKLVAKEKQWLEAHEIYEINYEQGTATFKEIVALCHYCHNYIHSGRLYMLWFKDKITTEKFEAVLNHGDLVLKLQGLKPNPFAQMVRLESNLFISIDKNVDEDEITKEITDLMGNSVKWKDWRMEFNGKKYAPKFKNKEEWRDHYENA